MPQPKELESHARRHIYPFLDQFGAKVVETYFDAQANAAPLQKAVVLVIEFKGQKIDVHSSTLQLGPIKFLLEHWDDVQAIIQDLLKVDVVFEKDIFVRFKSRWPQKSQRRDDTLAYAYICDRLRASGKRIQPNG
jgi:hypothetical protein